MDFKICAFFLLVVAVASAGVIPAIEVLQGPSSKTILYGPDGSALNSEAPGGTVVTNAHGSGLVAAGPAALPLSAPYVVHGPAGSIATSYTLGGPAVVAGVAPVAPIVIAAEPVLTGASANLGESAAAYEGAYVPDNSEAHYDDGSYKDGH